MSRNQLFIKYGSKNITFYLSFSVRKTLRIVVLPSGEVLVMAPIEAAISEINEKVKSKASWIIKQQAFFGKYKPQTPPRKFVNGETHLYLGRQYKLQIEKADIDDVIIKKGILIIKAKNIAPYNLDKIINKWYKARAAHYFSEILDNSLEKFIPLKINKPVFTIRLMQKRWGSCSKVGKIIFNTELIKAPKGSIEYVIIHELCHLVHYNHGKDFYSLQNSILPDWEKWKEKLEYILA